MIIEILGVPVTVERSDMSYTSNMGLWVETESRIRLDSTLKKELHDQTLLHEIIHAVESSLGLEMSEQTVTSLAAGMYQVMRANKKVFQDMLK
jgi:hypothetical protein